jgi:hypothetical protein
VRDDNDEHPLKQPSPRELTEFGIVRDDNDVHPSKQYLPRELTEFGIVRDNNDEHPLKQSSGKIQIASVNSNASIEPFKMISFPFMILKFSDIDQNDFD